MHQTNSHRIAPSDIIALPSGHIARVISIDDGNATLQYLSSPRIFTKPVSHLRYLGPDRPPLQVTPNFELLFAERERKLYDKSRSKSKSRGSSKSALTKASILDKILRATSEEELEHLSIALAAAVERDKRRA